MSITINDDAIQIGIPRKLKATMDKVSKQHDTRRLYKQVVKRNKRMEAVIEDLARTYGDDERFKSILLAHGVTI